MWGFDSNNGCLKHALWPENRTLRERLVWWLDPDNVDKDFPFPCPSVGSPYPQCECVTDLRVLNPVLGHAQWVRRRSASFSDTITHKLVGGPLDDPVLIDDRLHPAVRHHSLDRERLGSASGAEGRLGRSTEPYYVQAAGWSCRTPLPNQLMD